MTDDRRVQFDFEVEFSNGGGIQGQGFRLDIDGDDISDDELAAHIVRDMRLLMVGEVRILNKTIIRERHKRAAGGATPPAPADGRRRLDLSHTIEKWPQYADSTEPRIADTGTSLDRPFHLPLDKVADLDAVTVNVAGRRGRALGRSELLPYDVRGKAVLVHTGWDRHWRTDAYFDGHPYLTADAAAHLVAEGAVLVGIDSLNVDDTRDGERRVHSILLDAGIPICEHLTGLDRLPSSGFRFSAVPVKIRAMGTIPVRAYAVSA